MIEEVWGKLEFRSLFWNTDRSVKESETTKEIELLLSRVNRGVLTRVKSHEKVAILENARMSVHRCNKNFQIRVTR